VYDNLRQPKPLNHFTVGINDDVTGLSLPFDAAFSTEPEDVFRAVFFGLGADGTVSANKNSIKIIGEQTDNYAQGYFVYDSKKSGSITISHLRFGPRPIRSAYLVSDAHFVACHQFNFLTRYDMLKYARPNGVFLLNAPYGKDEVWDKLPKMVQDAIIRKNLKFYVIDAENVSAKSGMGRRINTVMQTAFFAVSGILPKEEAIGHIKKAIQKTYGKRGDLIVKQNFDAVDQTVANIFEVKPATVTALNGFRHYHAPANASDFIRNTTMRMIAGEGEELPVSAFEADGTFPSGTACLEKRAIANEIPIMDPDVCIQCGKCAFVCPHSVIRMKAFPKELLADAPANFHAMPAKGKDVPEGSAFAIQVSPDDCTGCTLCVEVCPAKNRSNASRKAVNMYPIEEVVAAERENWEFFLKLPELDRKEVKIDTVRGSQFLQPLFEFSGACSGCGETPYLKLLSQLFGDRMLVANATGCSSIYGGNLPTTPWTKNADGRGPAWANSLFEDNAEFGLGYRLAVDMKRNLAQQYLREMRTQIGEELAGTLLEMYPTDEAGISEHRKKVAELKAKLLSLGTPEAKRLLAIADFLVHKSLWIVGGDGWAYDIGYGGLDHVLASGRDINILVMDTEVYSNTGGQMSKATPIGAVAKFAAGGKATAKKDLAFQAIQYGNVYVARVAFGANDTQTLKVLLEAEAHPGPSLVIAYSHCIAHGYDLQRGLQQQKLAVDTAYWPLFRFNPALVDQGKNPLVLDSKPPKLPLSAYMENEGRFSMLKKIDPARAAELMEMAQEQVNKRWAQYEHMVKAYEPDPKPETV
jgi:pyruvate-ferredoxin/flavodoxin oxidoreductase